MNKKNLWLFLSFILTGAIWLLTPASNPSWIKHTILLGAFLYQIFLFLLLSKIPATDQKYRYFGLTEKLYTITLMAAMGIYTTGVLVVTPDTNPFWIKPLFLGIGLLILFGFFLYYSFKKVDEMPDERFYADLAKAACLTLTLVLICLLVLSVITFFMTLTLTTGVILIFSGIMIFVFDMAFFFFEKRGG